MAKRKKSEKRNVDRQPASAAKTHNANLFARTNRGILLDVLIFVANLFLMRLLTQLFIDIFRQASEEDALAKLALGFACLGMLILPAAGAVLKRWHFHRRLEASGETPGSEKRVVWGCLCNPIFYFCINLVIMSAVMTIFGSQVFGKAYEKNGAIFVTSVVVGLVITIVQTFLVYRYFSPPKAAPKSEFLRDPRSEVVGDICIFLNMILFQVLWNLATFMPLERVSGVGDFAGRLFFLSFIALLIYFPPRIFYLAEDINRPRVWLTMFLANSPIILRLLFGTSSNTMTI